MSSIVLLCVKGHMRERPFRILRLIDFEQVISDDTSLKWGVDPRGTTIVHNPDGTSGVIPAHQGFFFLDHPEQFFICYEFENGLVIHTNDHEEAIAKCEKVARTLEAKIFR